MTVYDLTTNSNDGTVCISNPRVLMDIFVTPTSDGVTPSTDIGVIKKASWKVIEEEYIRETAYPTMPLDQYNTKQGLELVLTIDQLSLTNVQMAIHGTTRSNSIGFGGQRGKPVYQCRMTKTLSNLTVRTIDFWKLIPKDAPEFIHEVAKPTEVQLAFSGFYSGVDWCNVAITSNNAHLFDLVDVPV